MKKRLLSVCFILFLLQGASAQVEFMHSLGLKYMFYSNSDGARAGLVLYSPRVNVLGNDNNTLSIGTHLGVGFSVAIGLYGNSSTLVLDAPLVAEYNFGFGASRKSTANIGGFVGAGYGMNRISVSANSESENLTLHGPVFNGGIRFYIHLVGSFEVAGSYMPDNRGEADKFNTFGVSISYMLGMKR